MALFSRIYHVSLFCNDIEKSLAFYQALGAEIAYTIKEDGDDEAWNYYLKIAEGQFIELQPCKSPNPHPHPENAKYYDDQTVWHFSFETDDMIDMISTLRERGITIYQFPDPGAAEVFSIKDAVLSSDGAFICWVKDPDGTPIELMELSKHAASYRACRK